MGVDCFKSNAQTAINDLRDLILTMPDKSDVSEDSQKIFLLQKLAALQRAFNGIEQTDLN